MLIGLIWILKTRFDPYFVVGQTSIRGIAHWSLRLRASCWNIFFYSFQAFPVIQLKPGCEPNEQPCARVIGKLNKAHTFTEWTWLKHTHRPTSMFSDRFAFYLRSEMNQYHFSYFIFFKPYWMDSGNIQRRNEFGSYKQFLLKLWRQMSRTISIFSLVKKFLHPGCLPTRQQN